MRPIVLTIEIARPPDEVFSYVTDPSRFSEWQADATRGRFEGDGPVGVGSGFITTRRIGRAERTTTSEITENNPPSSWAAHGIDGPIRPIMHVTVTPLGESARSRVTIDVDFRGHGIGKLHVPLVRWLGRKDGPRNCRNLKERLEGGDEHASM
jgi:uncharacterized protein YndB with AHSA1/START domain